MKYVTPPGAPSKNVLLYGPPKTSKTTAACGAPGPVGLLNCDLPNATLFAHQHHAPGQVQEIAYEGYQTIKEMTIDVEAGTFPHPTVVVDPVGNLYLSLVQEISRGAISPGLQAYQAAGVHVERFCRMLCKAPGLNVVLVCHEFQVKDGDTIEKLAFTGSSSNPTLSNKLMGMVDILGYCGVVEREGEAPQYLAQLINGNGRRGGDRFDTLGRMAPLDLGEWFRVIDAAIATRHTEGMTNDSAETAQESTT